MTILIFKKKQKNDFIDANTSFSADFLNVINKKGEKYSKVVESLFSIQLAAPEKIQAAIEKRTQDKAIK